MFGSVTVKVKDLHFRPTSSLDFPPCCHVGESCCEEGSCCSAASAHDDDASTARVSACHAASHGSRSSRCCYWGRLWWRCGSRGWCIIKVRSFSTTRTKLWQMKFPGPSHTFSSYPVLDWVRPAKSWMRTWMVQWHVSCQIKGCSFWFGSLHGFDLQLQLLLSVPRFWLCTCFFWSSREFCVIWKYYYFTR